MRTSSSSSSSWSPLLAVLVVAGLSFSPAVSAEGPPAPASAEATAATAPAPAPAPAPAADGSKVVVGIDKGFSVGTADGKFKLRIFGWAQLMWTGTVQDGPYTEWEQISWTDTDATSASYGNVSSSYEKHTGTTDPAYVRHGDFAHEFAVRRARLYAVATLFGQITTFLGLEFNRAIPVMFAHVTYQPLPEIGVRVGLFKAPLSRQFLTIPWRRSFPSDAMASGTFKLGWHVGVALSGSVAKHLFDYELSVTKSPTTSKATQAEDVLVAGRVSTQPLGPMPAFEGDFAQSPDPLLMIGLSAAYNPSGKSYYVKRTDTHGFDKKDIHTEQFVLAADLSLAWRGLYVGGEVYYRDIWPDHTTRSKLKTSDPNQDGLTESFGWYFQASYFLWAKHIELAARVSMVRAALEIKDDDKWAASGVLNLYPFGYAVVVQAEYTYLLDQVPESRNLVSHEFRLQTTFKF